MSESFPLAETLARQMFVAEFGHTGMSWDDLSDAGHDEWERKANRVLEGWWNPKRPFLLLDLAEDRLRFVDRGDLLHGLAPSAVQAREQNA